MTEVAKKYLQDCYRYDTTLPRGYISSPLRSFQTHSDIEALNRALGFKTNNKLIEELFLEGKSPNFLKMICDEPKIDLGVGQYRKNGLTLLQAIMNTPEIRYADLLSCLFAKTYKVTEGDRVFVAAKLDSFVKEESFRVGLLLAYSKLTKPLLAFDLLSIKQQIFHLLSAEQNKVVGLRFSNLKEVTNSLFEHYPGFASVYIEILKAKGHFDKLLNEDHSGSITPKLTQSSPLMITDELHKKIIKDLFPYLSLGTIRY